MYGGRSLQSYMRSAATRKRCNRYLKQWKIIKKDKGLKNVPTYFGLAKAKKLNTGQIVEPRARCILLGVSRYSNILKPTTALYLHRSIGNCACRDDGRVPPLRNGRVFSPAAATYLDSAQMIILSGLFPEHNHDVFVAAAQLDPDDMPAFLAATTPLPIAKVLASVALSMMK